MALKLTMGGSKSTSKSKAKPAAKAKSTGTKRSTAKAKAAPKRSTAKKTSQTTQRQAPAPKVDPKVHAQHTKALEQAGARHRGARDELEDAINNVHEVVEAAREAGLGMSHIERTVGVSRQWLYKMGTTAKRNGNGSKPAAKRTRGTAKSGSNSSKATPARKRGAATKKTSGGARPKIKINK